MRQEMTVAEKKARIERLKEAALKNLQGYADSKLKNIRVVANGIVDTRVFVLGNEFVNIEPAKEFLQERAKQVALNLIEDRESAPAFHFEKGARYDFPEGPGAPFPTRDGWAEINAYVERTYGTQTQKIFDDIVIKDANTRNRGYIPFHFFFPEIEYDEVIGNRR